MHLKSSVFSPEPAGFSRVLLPRLGWCSKIYSLFSSKKFSPKPFVSSIILTSPNRSNLFPIVVWLEIFPSLQLISRALLSGDQGCFPVPLRRVRTIRSSTHSHPFQVSLHTPRTLSHNSTFISRTCNLWNVLSSSSFPESYNLPSFKSRINKLDLISLSS